MRRPRPRATPSVVLLTLALAGPPATAEQAGAPPSSPPASETAAAELFGEAKLAAYADAEAKVMIVINTMLQKIMGTRDVETRLRFREEARAEIRAILAAHPGITPEEYDEIARRAGRDLELRKRIDALAAKAAKAGGG